MCRSVVDDHSHLRLALRQKNTFAIDLRDESDEQLSDDEVNKLFEENQAAVALVQKQQKQLIRKLGIKQVTAAPRPLLQVAGRSNDCSDRSIIIAQTKAGMYAPANFVTLTRLATSSCAGTSPQTGRACRQLARD